MICLLSLSPGRNKHTTQFLLGQVHEELQREAHLVCRMLLQTPDQINRGIVALCAQAQSEGYVHVEIVCRPTDHCQGGLTALEALDVVIEAVQSTTSLTTTGDMTADQTELGLDPHLLGSFTAGLVISIDGQTSDADVNMELIRKVIEVRGGSPFAVKNQRGEHAEPDGSTTNDGGAILASNSVPSVLAVSLSGGVIEPSWLDELKRSLCPVVVAIGQQQKVEGSGDGNTQIAKVVDSVQLGAARIRKLCTTLPVLSRAL
eukprot:COSAG02_NODE_1066_length_14828_cov_8.021794_7_plen_260_part_00